ncbi:hypothetical protein AAHE18_12G187000 [Arachis hypogaea]
MIRITLLLFLNPIINPHSLCFVCLKICPIYIMSVPSFSGNRKELTLYFLPPSNNTLVSSIMGLGLINHKFIYFRNQANQIGLVHATLTTKHYIEFSIKPTKFKAFIYKKAKTHKDSP